MGISSFFRSPSLAPSEDNRVSPTPLASDDECLSRLAQAVAEHDEKQLGEVAKLIGRLAVPIE